MGLATSKTSEHPTSPYRPLKEGEIRLCTVSLSNPDTLGEQLCCTLRPARLANRPSYSCISYVWGTSDQPIPIKLNGIDHIVRENLHAVLQSLQRNGDVDRANIWVDALCIKQEDHAEKAQQVSLMGRIFHEAEEVLVWLGEDAGHPSRDAAFPSHPLHNPNHDAAPAEPGAPSHPAHTRDAIHFLHLLSKSWHFHDLPYFARCAHPNCPAVRPPDTATGNWPATLAALRPLMTAAWFTRTWTVQEIVLARRATALYGAHRIPWALLEDAWSQFAHHLNGCCSECIVALPWGQVQELSRSARAVVELLSAKGWRRSRQGMLLALLAFKRRRTSDPRDRLYGLLGLQGQEEEEAAADAEGQSRRVRMQPDYTLSLAETFVRFAHELIRSSGGRLIPLQLDLTHRLPGLPSWVPDWTRASPDPADYAVHRLESLSFYAADRGLTTPSSDPASTSVQAHVLHARGLHIDTLAAVSAPYTLTATPAAQLALLASWSDFLSLPTQGTTPYAPDNHHHHHHHSPPDNPPITLHQAYLHTLFAGLYLTPNHTPRPLQPPDLAAYQARLAYMTAQLRTYGPTAAIGLHGSLSAQSTACLGRRLFVSRRGYLGLCPAGAETGDAVAVVAGSSTPVFLRGVGGEGEGRGEGAGGRRFRALGDGYVQGLMQGGAVGLGLPLEAVEIV